MKRNEIVAELRRLSEEMEADGRDVTFVENDCPFVDKACEAIEHGGHMDATCMASLVYHLANMMEE